MSDRLTRRLVAFPLLALLGACAPQVIEEPAPVAAEPTPEPQTEPVTPRVVEQPVETPPPVAVQPTPEPQQRFDPANPDWKLRYQQLYQYYLGQFEAPVIGQTYDVMLLNGRVQQGVLEAVTDSEITLNIGSGQLTLTADNMAEGSRAEFFRNQYAHLNALARGRAEYARWQAMQEAAKQPTPTPIPPRVAGQDVPQQPWRPLTDPPPKYVGGEDGVNIRHRIDPNAPPPRNEGPKGRVWQVDQYIRKNAAIPHSLKYISWGPVQKNGDGYMVRVKYTLESAEGLGTSTEDMTFFMYADGTVYRRAANK